MRTTLRRTVARTLTGGSIGHQTQEVLGAFERGSGVADPNQVDSIVSHAVRAVPFYQRYGSSATNIEDLPVVNKLMMKESPREFIQEGMVASRLKSRSTSGSTGIPFTVFMDLPRANRNRAAAAAALIFAGGDPYGPQVQAKAWAKLSTKERLKLALKEYYPYNGDHFRASDVLPIANWIKQRQPALIQGYASYLEKMFRVFEADAMSFPSGSVTAIMSASEPPTKYYFEASKRLFGVAAHARYSNMELGVMGMSLPDTANNYKLDTTTFHFEILHEDSDAHVSPGELGRLVVTDLHNRAMPLIRYDTGDLARFSQSSSGDNLPDSITDLRGRRLDILVGGTPSVPHRMHPLAVWGPVAELSEIRQFQLIQHDVGKFTWKINAEPSKELEDRLREILSARIGDITHAEIDYVSDVPVMSSGKRQFFVNEIPDPLNFIAIRSGR